MLSRELLIRRLANGNEFSLVYQNQNRIEPRCMREEMESGLAPRSGLNSVVMRIHSFQADSEMK